MNDFEYDVMQKKRIARQAKYKKNGSKSKRCTLRQDGMTDAQLRKMNGDIVQFHMDRPIRSWSEFRGLSGASAAEYIGGLIDRYGVSVGDLARMFGVTYGTVKTYLQSISSPVPHGRMPQKNVSGWEEFLSYNALDETAPEKTEEKQDGEEADKPDAAETKCEEYEPRDMGTSMEMNVVTLEFSGGIDFMGIVNSLRFILGGDPVGTLRIDFRAEPKQA